MNTTKCEKCGHDIQIGEHPYCPHGFGTFGVQDDSIPGGILIKNGLCNPDGTPRRFDSKTDIKKAGEQAGYINVVEHKPPPGTDKSKHTVRWI